VGENASIEITRPRKGDSLSSTDGINGSATLPAEHQIWLLWRHGNDAPFHVAESCFPDEAFYCDPIRLPSDGAEGFGLYAIVVTPDTAATLSPGKEFLELPPTVAYHGMAVKRQTENR
jgi:hypothetical protein